MRNAGGKRIVDFEINEKVWTRSFSKNAAPWIEAIINKKLGPITYELKCNTDLLIKRCIDQIKKFISMQGNKDNVTQVPQQKWAPILRQSERLKEKNKR